MTEQTYLLRPKGVPYFVARAFGRRIPTLIMVEQNGKIVYVDFTYHLGPET